jgi:signal transduction histidine kinase
MGIRDAVTFGKWDNGGMRRKRPLPAAQRSAAASTRGTGPSVRTWILAAMVGLTIFALATAGIVAAELQSMRVDDRMADDLEASADEFRVLAELGLDPATGQPFSTPNDLVRTAMTRVIPARHEGVLGFVNGELEYTTPVPSVALAEDAELIAELVPLTQQDQSTLTAITTATTTYRVVVVPATTVADNGEVPSEPQVAALVLAYDRTAEQAEFQDIFVRYAWVAVGAVGIVAVVGWILAGILLRPIRVLVSSARRIGREDLSERIPVTGSDDLADMTVAVNEMLERLDGAFKSQKDLMNDVSHELRTPLTVVRGHLELMDAHDQQDSEAVRELVLGELDRMNLLVDDLMTLATSDRPTFVQQSPTPVGRLTDDVFDKALALGERQWTVADRAEVTANVDPHRVTQAWLQLAANAVKFSAPGSPIMIGSRVSGDAIELWVEDHGVGVPPEDRERIFERFTQSQPHSRQGAGLGLAIVAAIAHAHSGTVRCDSELGRGSTFTLTLPIGDVV